MTIKPNCLLTGAIVLASMSVCLISNDAFAATPSASKKETSPATEVHAKGTSLAAKKDYQAAIAEFDKAIALDPKDVAPYLERAICYMYLNNYTKVIEDCKFVIENGKAHKKEQREAMMIAAGASNMSKNYAAGLDYSTKALAIEPSALIYADRAVSNKELGKLSDALADCEQAIKMDSKRGGFYVLRAAIYEQMAMADRKKAKTLATDLVKK